MEHGVAQELHIERSSSLSIVGNVYRGKVCRVLPGMQSAFVEIGLQRAAFLHAADVMGCHVDGEPPIERPIQEVLREGQSIIVQVIKEPIGTKGARPLGYEVLNPANNDERHEGEDFSKERTWYMRHAFRMLTDALSCPPNRRIGCRVPTAHSRTDWS